MASPTELMLEDLSQKYAHTPVSNAFMRLYEREKWLGRIFASLHERLNEHFEAINGRTETTRHYWADPSRTMLALLKEIDEVIDSLAHANLEVELAGAYRAAIDGCKAWLKHSGGSSIPEEFKQIGLIKYEPAFTLANATVRLKKGDTRVQLQLIGEGSYAKVFSFVDPDYDIKFAVKRANKDLSERDLHRFRQEFKILKRLSFPYIVQVYQYDETRHEYKMEFCEATLRAYIKRRNSTLRFASRKRIALQFLYGINYIHSEHLLHRDISLQNVLVKTFAGGAVLVKLSDFGLVKEKGSDFTRTKTEMRGTIRDPLLPNFKDYEICNEIYAIGHILSYIFSGRESLMSGTDAASQVVRKCTAHDIAARYQTVLDIIQDVERLEATPADAPA
ncbi:protein kinase family protein [Streptomyces griseoaurantiacus]|uniref:protein kinase family protein n=1 Tax=Streptomyces griseoaurantiacus TaxID=68213 RepID=UPI0037BCED71